MSAVENRWLRFRIELEPVSRQGDDQGLWVGPAQELAQLFYGSHSDRGRLFYIESLIGQFVVGLADLFLSDTQHRPPSCPDGLQDLAAAGWPADGNAASCGLADCRGLNLVTAAAVGVEQGGAGSRLHGKEPWYIGDQPGLVQARKAA